ncbi:FMN reductase [Myceligenerans crystallogenes]|uniref:FMN reductase n=1 Tax=Myceligenerans crystallogenes TaxID=316335 RepID=A0ABN2N8C7_9MICO
MTTPRTLAVVSAGLSRPSSTRLLADRLAAATARELERGGRPDGPPGEPDGVIIDVIELREHAHAIMDAMLTGFATGELERAIGRLTRADGIIAVSPLFTTTYSGLFKSFLDVLDKDALTGMPVLLGATGGTPRHSLALDYSMRPLFTYLRADVVPTAVFAATDDWARGGAGPDDGSAAGRDAGSLPGRIDRAGRELAARVAARRHTGPADPFGATPDFLDLLGEQS